MIGFPNWQSAFDTHTATAETIARRLPILWWGMLAPSPAAHAEIFRMVSEKQMALAEGLFAMQAELVKFAFRPWWMAQASHAIFHDLAHAAAAPAARKVKANARRLRRY